jgi:hypothetical protein
MPQGELAKMRKNRIEIEETLPCTILGRNFDVAAHGTVRRFGRHGGFGILEQLVIDDVRPIDEEGADDQVSWAALPATHRLGIEEELKKIILHRALAAAAKKRPRLMARLSPLLPRSGAAAQALSGS